MSLTITTGCTAKTLLTNVERTLPTRDIPTFCLKLSRDVRRPNITGYTGAAWDDTSGDVTGAFYFSGDAAESANGHRGRYGISFDASRVNSAYSRSRTVQPASVRSLYCIKS